MKIKAGVDLGGWRAPMWRAAAVVEEVYLELTGEEATLTSGVRNEEGKSLHGDGLAGDWSVVPELRTEKMQQVLVARLKSRLGPDYDILIHDVGQGLHLHVEFDPT